MDSLEANPPGSRCVEVLVFATLNADPIPDTTRFTLPLYEYQCRACRKTEEVRHGFKETFDGKCAACGGEMARVFSPAGIVFKGSGFYLTDSRKAEAASPAGGSSTPAASEAASSAPAATSTPAATPAAAPAASKSESAA
jgi:putative FmdB family regulatory protein